MYCVGFLPWKLRTYEIYLQSHTRRPEAVLWSLLSLWTGAATSGVTCSPVRQMQSEIGARQQEEPEEQERPVRTAEQFLTELIKAVTRRPWAEVEESVIIYPAFSDPWELFCYQ